MSFLKIIESISGGQENAVCLGPLLLSCCESTSWSSRSALNCQIKLCLRLLIDLDQVTNIVSWILAVWPWVHPWSGKSISITSKCSKFDALLFLLTPFIFIPSWVLWFQWAMERIADVNVSARTWIWSLYLLITCPVVAAAEWWLNGFIHYNLVFNVIFLFLMVIFSRTWIDSEGLPCVWSHTFMLPEFTSLGLEQEWLRLLPDELAVRVHSLMFIGFLFNRDHSFICTWPRSFTLIFCILAVGHFRLENSIFTSRIELLLSKLLVIIDSWSRIFVPCLIVMCLFMILK